MQLIKTGKYQNKLLWVVLSSIIVLLLAWNGAFKKTIVAYSDVRELKNSINSLEQNSIQKQQLQSEISQLNSVLGIGEDKMKTEANFEELVNLCETIEDIRIINFPDIHQVEINGYKVTTTFAVFEGSYSGLLALVYKLERNKKTGRLVSVDFKKNKDIKKGNEFLSLTILIQNYELISQQ
jgi:Tfp pilus assembly protein PilO